MGRCVIGVERKIVVDSDESKDVLIRRTLYHLLVSCLLQIVKRLSVGMHLFNPVVKDQVTP